MNILFIWIPKNAGSSFFELMKAQHDMKLFMDDNYYNFTNEGSVTFGHLNVQHLINAKIIKQSYWQEAKKVAIVRNPYSRFISLYLDFKRTGRISPHMMPKEFAHAIRHMSRAPGMFNALDYSQAASQVNWLLPGVEVLRFESLQRDINLMFGSGYVLPHENSSGDDWRRYYDEELQSMVYDLFFDSFVLLNYKREL